MPYAMHVGSLAHQKVITYNNIISNFSRNNRNGNAEGDFQQFHTLEKKHGGQSHHVDRSAKHPLHQVVV